MAHLSVAPSKCESTDASHSTNHESVQMTSAAAAPGCTTTIIEQLIQRNPNPNPSVLLSPFFMCSESEALDRQSYLELSPFECINISMAREDSSSLPTNKIQDFSVAPHRSAVWDRNEINLESPIPKVSSLAAAAAKSFVCSKHVKIDSAKNGNVQQSSVYIPPWKRNDPYKHATLITSKSPEPIKNEIKSLQSDPPSTNPKTPIPKQESRHRPIFHPNFVIKKYRRSAAGGGSSKDTPRTVEQLLATVDYLLLQIMVWQRSPLSGTEHGSSLDHLQGLSEGPEMCEQQGKHQQQQQQQEYNHYRQFSLSETVNFIDDRLRAVQKDLVTLQGYSNECVDTSKNFKTPSSPCLPSPMKSLPLLPIKPLLRKMQARMVRYHILVLYLLSSAPSSKYEVKFGSRALRTCLTNFLHLSESLSQECSSHDDDASYQEEYRVKDEMMAYMGLLHSSAILRLVEPALPPLASSGGAEISSVLMEESGSGWGAFLSTFSKHALEEERAHVSNNYPRWKWALEVACAIQNGNYQRYFSLLDNGPSPSPSVTLNTTDPVAVSSEHARFLILARCCSSHSINLIRLSALRQYNYAFGKGEQVSGREMARLFRFINNNMDVDELYDWKEAINFCRDAGLPIIENNDGCKGDSVGMKLAPISISGDGPVQKMSNPGRVNDYFVFGTNFQLLHQKRNGSESSRRSLLNQLEKLDIAERGKHWQDPGREGRDAFSEKEILFADARVDEDGVVIPPRAVIHNIVC